MNGALVNDCRSGRTSLQHGERHTYRLAQLITGHGGFADYLCKSVRWTANYFHCGDHDSTFNMVAVCPVIIITKEV